MEDRNGWLEWAIQPVVVNVATWVGVKRSAYETWRKVKESRRYQVTATAPVNRVFVTLVSNARDRARSAFMAVPSLRNSPAEARSCRAEATICKGWLDAQDRRAPLAEPRFLDKGLPGPWETISPMSSVLPPTQ